MTELRALQKCREHYICHFITTGNVWCVEMVCKVSVSGAVRFSSDNKAAGQQWFSS